MGGQSSRPGLLFTMQSQILYTLQKYSKDPVGAEEYLRNKFEAHLCHVRK